MTTRDAPLFAAGKPTVHLIHRWRDAGARHPLPRDAVLERDRSATPWFRSFAGRVLPEHEPIPFGALCDERGVGSQAFLDWLDGL